MGFIDTTIHTVLNLIFPSRCALCGKSGVDLCSACLREAPAAERECAEWIFPLYDYRYPPLKKSLWLLKYKGKKRLANIFAEIMYEKVLEELSELSTLENFIDPLIIPIPLSRTRFHERGYNQAELICRELLVVNNTRDKLNWTLETNILIKPKETPHQAHLHDRKTRFKNLKGTFALKNEAARAHIEKRNIILVDDIITTGATLDEARRILKEGGARKIIAFTVAH